MAPIIYLKECASTNEEILHFLNSDDTGLSAVYTFNQKKGKGQYGNSWESAAGINLAFTVSVPTALIKMSTHSFNFHTAAAVADFLAIMTKTQPEIKWPNDIIIKNKKVAGLLLEKKTVAGISYFIVGIGLNVLQEKFPNLPKAGSLLTQTGVKFSLHNIANELYAYLQRFLLEETAESDVLEKFNTHLFRKDKISVFEIEGVRQNGIIRKVDPDGFLWVDLEIAGFQKFYHKEIELLY